MVVIPFFIVTKFSFLHFGQKRGKFTSSVSLRILVRVLLLQTGQSTHICCSAIKITCLMKWLKKELRECCL